MLARWLVGILACPMQSSVQNVALAAPLGTCGVKPVG